MKKADTKIGGLYRTTKHVLGPVIHDSVWFGLATVAPWYIYCGSTPFTILEITEVDNDINIKDLLVLFVQPSSTKAKGLDIPDGPVTVRLSMDWARLDLMEVK